MSKRDRVETVLRVRRVQEMQAAGEMARAAAVAHLAEQQLAAVRDRYDAGRVLDPVSDAVPARLRDHEARVRQAEAIQRGRERVRDAVEQVSAHRDILMLRTQAVRAMERLDQRLAVEDEAEARRRELRDLDERATSMAIAAAKSTGSNP